MEQTIKQTTQLHEDKFFKVFWDESARIICIDWKEATSSMTDEEFKAELTLFAGQVEQKKARGILVDVSRFHHRPGPGRTAMAGKEHLESLLRRRCRAICLSLPGGRADPADDESVIAGREFSHPSVHRQETSS